MFSVHIQAGPITLAAPSAPAGERCGAQVCFVGKVRNDAREAPLSHLVLEHFPGVTEAEIGRIMSLARERWKLQSARVVHRVGRIGVGEDIVVVETASAHRKDAYEANAFIMDYLKTEAPFWKQECFADGRELWVEARSSDQRAARRWQADGRPAVPAPRRRIGALVLAGGLGSRMEYRNKGLQPLCGRPLVQHVAAAVQPHVDYLAISANAELADYEALGFPVFADDPAYGVQGPLAGILSALPRFPADLDALLVVPCDTPLLPADLAPRLAQALFARPAPPAVMAATAESIHPSIFMCRPGMLVSLLRHLGGQAAGFSLRAWLQGHGCAAVHFDETAAFSNINDPRALQALQARLDDHVRPS